MFEASKRRLSQYFFCIGTWICRLPGLFEVGAIAPMLDSTMVNIDIDKLTKDFNTTLDTIQWSITGYVLTLTIVVPVTGWLINKFNRKKIFVG